MDQMESQRYSKNAGRDKARFERHAGEGLLLRGGHRGEGQPKRGRGRFIGGAEEDALALPAVVVALVPIVVTLVGAVLVVDETRMAGSDGRGRSLCRATIVAVVPTTP